MKSLILSLIILSSAAMAGESSTESSCDWLIGKWKCERKISWSGLKETMYYNIVRSSESSFRINFHTGEVPGENSALGFVVYLDGRLNHNIGGISRCEDSKLNIDYLENMSDEDSINQQLTFEKQLTGMQLINAYLRDGAVSFSNCSAL